METSISPLGPTVNLPANVKTPITLLVGEIVRAVVQDRVSQDAVLLQLGNLVIQAKTDLPLNAGQVLFLKVDTLGNEIQLRVTAGPAESYATLTDALLSALAGLKNREPASADLIQLSDFLKAIPDELKQQIPELRVLEGLLLRVDTLTGERLEKAVIDSGVLFEKKLRIIAENKGNDATLLFKDGLQVPGSDLKGILLKIRSYLGEPEIAAYIRDAGIAPQQLERTIEKLIGTIEYQQMQSKLGDSLQLFLPMLWQDLREEWIKFKKTKKNQVDQSFSCTVNLDLERIGKLRSHLLWQSGRIHIKMVSDNPAFVDMVRDHSGLLGKQLEDSGLNMGGMSVTFKRDIDFDRDIPDGLDIRV
jgi:hypothetical protein